MGQKPRGQPDSDLTGSDPDAAPPSNLDLCLCLQVWSTVGLVSESRISSTHSVPGPQSVSGSGTPTTRTRRRKVPPSVFKGRGKFNRSEARPNGSPDQQKGTGPSPGRLQMSVSPEASQLVLYSKGCSSQSSDASVNFGHVPCVGVSEIKGGAVQENN